MRSGRGARCFAVLGAAAAAVGLGACGAAATVPGSALVPGHVAPGDHTVYVTVGAMRRSLVLFVPPLPAAPGRPLILVYHGANDTASGTESSTDLRGVADRTGELVAFLQGYGNAWNEGAGHTPAERANVDDVAFTTAAIRRIESLVAFDHARIAAVGFSNGALMAEYLGCRLAGTLAAIIPVEGQLPVAVARTCLPSMPVGVYEVHGTADASIPYGGGHFNGIGGGTTVLSAPRSAAVWAHLDGCAAPRRTRAPSRGVRLTVYAGCRGSRTVVLRTVLGGAHQWPPDILSLIHI